MSSLSWKKKFGALVCAGALLLGGCTATAPSPAGVYGKGIDQFKEIYAQVMGTTPGSAGSNLVSDPQVVGPAAAPVEDVISTEQPLYVNYSYYLPALAGDEKENFYALYKGIQNFEKSISLPHPVKSEEVADLMSLLHNECPELLQLDNVWTERTNLLESVISVAPQYLLEEKEYRTQLQEINRKVATWQTELAGLNSFDAELAIFNDIVAGCAYSTKATYCQTAYGALVDGLAKCDGRAKAMAWGLRSLGITCSVITGSNHAWLIAHIGDYDYNVDPTYDDNEDNGKQLEITYTHFNVPEAAIANDPYPVDEFFVRRGYPPTTRWDANYHVRTGKYVGAGQDASALFAAQLAEAYQAGSGMVNLRFEQKADMEAAQDVYTEWIQSFINRYGVGCSMVSYDCSEFNTLAVKVTFKK